MIWYLLAWLLPNSACDLNPRFCSSDISTFKLKFTWANFLSPVPFCCPSSPCLHFQECLDGNCARAHPPHLDFHSPVHDQVYGGPVGFKTQAKHGDQVIIWPHLYHSRTSTRCTDCGIGRSNGEGWITMSLYKRLSSDHSFILGQTVLHSHNPTDFTLNEV